MSNNQHAAKAKRLRFAPLAIATGVLGAVLLSVSMSGTLSGFVASIQNTSNTTASGALTMQETSSATGTAVTCNSTDGGTVSTNAATCATINKYGGSTTMIPGQTVSTAIAIKNTGTVAASTFALAAGTCTQGTNGALNGTASDLCTQMTVVITNTTTSTAVFSGTLAAFKTQGSIPLGAAAPGASTAFTIAVTLPSTLGNTYQGLSVSQPMTWTYNS
ncbi:hypothetical protein AX769_19895 [Frondihabitans sp. PAMC 28766]|uniref:hypothetical protein n=1 Tax=Frondihabitans sp. PAMC 28766 TaxID=1795630 RepID=UPI00078BEF24|nr:hypothetical protein [Frondihabitans sp. PAMC 28766]AMM21995.1 hypothetical protein AX769_19895 [Frondihabitans sp. PAMC 28766]